MYAGMMRASSDVTRSQPYRMMIWREIRKSGHTCCRNLTSAAHLIPVHTNCGTPHMISVSPFCSAYSCW